MTPEELKQIPFVETHCHLDWEFAEAEVTPASLMDLCDEENATYSLLIGADPDTQIEAIRERKERFGYLLWPRPKDLRWWAGYEQILLDNRDVIRGIKLHPHYDRYFAGLDLLEDVFASACNHDFVIATHTMDDPTSRAEQFRPMLEKHPRTKLILYHATPFDDALALMKEFPNVYMDISAGAFGEQAMLKALDVVGQKKILFGVDTPLGFPVRDGKYQHHLRDVIEKEIALWVDYDENILRDILYRNAAKLLNLNISE